VSRTAKLNILVLSFSGYILSPQIVLVAFKIICVHQHLLSHLSVYPKQTVSNNLILGSRAVLD